MNLVPLLIGAILLAAGELGRAYEVSGHAGLLIFFLPAIPIYLLLAQSLQDRWERFLIASSIYLGLVGFVLFTMRMVYFIPITYSNLLLVSEAFGIVASSLLSLRPTALKAKFSFDRSSLAIFAILIFTAFFYTSAAQFQDSWQKELRQVTWATDVFPGVIGTTRMDVLQFMIHAPFHPILGTITAYMFGFSQTSKAYLYTIFAVFEVLLLMLLSQHIFKKREIGFFAVFFLFSSGLFLHFTTTATPTSPETYFQLLTFYVLYRYLQKREKLFFCLIPLFFSLSFYSKTESSAFLVPISAFLLFKNITPSPKDLSIKNVDPKPLAGFLILTAVLAVPFIVSGYDSDVLSQGQQGPFMRMRIAYPNGLISTVSNLDHFATLFPGTTWGYNSPDVSTPISEYVRRILSGEGVSNAKPVMGGDNPSGSFYETPQMYFLYLSALMYFAYRKLRAHTLFVCYTLYSFIYVFTISANPDWNQFLSGWILGFLVLGYFFSRLIDRLRTGTAYNAALLAIFCFVLVSSLIYTTNTVFNFNYYSGVNFYRDSLFLGEPMFGVFAVGKYIREHTTAAETYLADVCYLPEVVINRNAWIGAAPPSYSLIATESFPRLRSEAIGYHKQRGYIDFVKNNKPAVNFLYKGFPYVNVYKLSDRTKYLDEGVCIEASEYGRDYKPWGLFFSDPAGPC